MKQQIQVRGTRPNAEPSRLRLPRWAVLDCGQVNSSQEIHEVSRGAAPLAAGRYRLPIPTTSGSGFKAVNWESV
jgi:hypothetical protein